MNDLEEAKILFKVLFQTSPNSWGLSHPTHLRSVWTIPNDEIFKTFNIDNAEPMLKAATDLCTSRAVLPYSDGRKVWKEENVGKWFFVLDSDICKTNHASSFWVDILKIKSPDKAIGLTTVFTCVFGGPVSDVKIESVEIIWEDEPKNRFLALGSKCTWIDTPVVRFKPPDSINWLDIPKTLLEV